MGTRWTHVSKGLPPLHKPVLVCRRGDVREAQIMQLRENDYIQSGDPHGVVAKCHVWHNGYSGFPFFDSYWRDVPKPPPLNAKDRALIARLQESNLRALKAMMETITDGH
jgi:hypothetical protein